MRNDDLPAEQLMVVAQIRAFGADYDPNCGLTLEDQLLACEAVAESTPVKEIYYPITRFTGENASVNGMSYGTCKRSVNFELTHDKLQIIAEIKNCNYRTPPVKVAELLESFFAGYGTQQGWWLAVANMWSPREIVWNLNYMVKRSWIGFRNPASYFSSTIKHRKKRKEIRRTNGTYKQQSI